MGPLFCCFMERECLKEEEREEQEEQEQEEQKQEIEHEVEERRKIAVSTLRFRTRRIEKRRTVFLLCVFGVSVIRG